MMMGGNQNIDYDGNSYSKYRPSYSNEIFSLTYKFHDAHKGSYDVAIDSGTGTGQVAVELSSQFKQVYGIDYLAAQIESATPRDNIIYKVGPGEDFSSFEDHSVDLITVGTAFHWFNHEKFFTEAKRVLKPKTGTLSIFGYFYPLLQNQPKVNEAVNAVWNGTFGKYTNDNVHFISNLYRDIAFPFKEQQWYITPHSLDTTQIGLPTEGPLMALTMPLQNYLNFFLTSSAYQNYLKDKEISDKEDPVNYLTRVVLEALNTDDLQTPVNVEWPTVFVLARND